MKSTLSRMILGPAAGASLRPAAAGVFRGFRGMLAAAVVAALVQQPTLLRGAGPALTALAGIDTPGDPAQTSPSAADSPTASSGPFDATRGDLGADDDIGTEEKKRRRDAGGDRGPQAADAPTPADRIRNPLAGTPKIDPATTGKDAEIILASLLPPRSDSPADWFSPIECLHRPGEPRALPPCVPGPPCHPSQPPFPYDLIGMRGEPSCGPIYDGPCAPRAGTRDHCPHPRLNRICDTLFDCFYTPK